jgi:hypothetical protein
VPVLILWAMWRLSKVLQGTNDGTCRCPIRDDDRATVRAHTCLLIPHAGQARILKASTRNSIIRRTFGETNFREG